MPIMVSRVVLDGAVSLYEHDSKIVSLINFPQHNVKSLILLNFNDPQYGWPSIVVSVYIY